jgi:hypothetical protein
MDDEESFNNLVKKKILTRVSSAEVREENCQPPSAACAKLECPKNPTKKAISPAKPKHRNPKPRPFSKINRRT